MADSRFILGVPVLHDPDDPLFPLGTLYGYVEPSAEASGATNKVYMIFES
jgi:hypothetical protein